MTHLRLEPRDTLVKHDLAIEALTEAHRCLQEASRLVDQAQRLAVQPCHAGLYVDENRSLQTYKAILDAAAEVRFLRLAFAQHQQAAR